MKKYDVFISYRRDGGDMTASRLYDSLKEKGYRVFLDVREMGACVFDERLHEVIAHSRDFILVLTEGALDRCVNEGDWVRREIEWAMQSGCRIIPVREQGFVFPQDLPQELRILNMHNGPQISAAHWDSFVAQVCRDMKTRRFPWKRIIAAVVCLALCAAVGMFAYMEYKKQEQQRIEWEQKSQAMLTAMMTGDTSGLEAYFSGIEPEEEAPDSTAQAGKDGQYATGYEAYTAGDYEQAIALWTAEAENGEAKSMYNLGVVYRSGSGVERDYAQAMAWFEKAAELGHANAMNNIGILYEKGLGVPQDYEQAVEWFRKGAEAGSDAAMTNMGMRYQNGEGVPQDYEQAVEWFRKGAEAGSSQSMNNLGVMYRDGLGVEQDYEQAAEWYRKGAEAGNSHAMVGLGNLYKDGLGVPQDDAQAVEWYRKGAGAGDSDAMVGMAIMYADGRGVEQDIEQAIAWYEKAAELGNSIALHNIGWIYDNGYYVPEDDAKALEYYTKALEAGYADAQAAIDRLNTWNVHNDAHTAYTTGDYEQ